MDVSCVQGKGGRERIIEVDLDAREPAKFKRLVKPMRDEIVRLEEIHPAG